MLRHDGRELFRIGSMIKHQYILFNYNMPFSSSNLLLGVVYLDGSIDKVQTSPSYKVDYLL